MCEISDCKWVLSIKQLHQPALVALAEPVGPKTAFYAKVFHQNPRISTESVQTFRSARCLRFWEGKPLGPGGSGLPAQGREAINRHGAANRLR